MTAPIYTEEDKATIIKGATMTRTYLEGYATSMMLDRPVYIVNISEEGCVKDVFSFNIESKKQLLGFYVSENPLSVTLDPNFVIEGVPQGCDDNASESTASTDTQNSLLDDEEPFEGEGDEFFEEENLDEEYHEGEDIHGGHHEVMHEVEIVGSPCDANMNLETDKNVTTESADNRESEINVEN